MNTLMDKRGVTLIELIIVLAIGGILATIAVPNYLKLLPKIRVNQATAGVSGMLIRGKLKSVSDNVAYIIEFDTANNICNMYKDADKDLLGDAGELVQTLDIGQEYKGIILGHNVTNDTKGQVIDDPSKKVKFYTTDNDSLNLEEEVFMPNGTAKYTGAVYLMPAEDNAAGRSDRNRAVTVEAMTGFVKSWNHEQATGGNWY